MKAPQTSGFEAGSSVGIPAERTIVAAIIEWRGKIALFKRSRGAGYDSGLWHCITGFVEVGATPEQQAREELSEETGLQAKDLLDLRAGPALVLIDRHGAAWLVYTYTAVTTCRRLRLDWEHDAYRWTTAQRVKRFTNRVSWLEYVLEATGHVPAPSQCGSGTHTQLPSQGGCVEPSNLLRETPSRMPQIQ